MKKTNLTKVVIVGRPNVGKSSLFNSILGKRKAIVEEASGTTRDRLHVDIKWKGKTFTLIDTAGFEDARPGEMSELVLKQIRKGIEEADMILFVTDGSAGIMPEDRDLASMLRKTSKKLCLAVNKIDRESDAGKALEFYELGLGEPNPVSAMQNRGVDRLCDILAKGLEKEKAPEGSVQEGVKVAIVGRPNVGKSSYLNAILNEERVIVHPTAGTTRDAIDINFNYNGKDFILIDTAGMRHNPKLKRAADFFGSVRSEEAIRRSDVAIMLIDGYEGWMKDDARIIDMCLSEGKPLVIAVNKWDLVKEFEMSKYTDRMIEEMDSIKNIPVVFMSAKTGRNINPSLDIILSVYEKSRAIIPPEKLAETLKAINVAPQIYGKKIKFRALVQEGSAPPSFILGGKSATPMNDNLERFLENFIRKAYDYKGVPIRIRYR